MSLILIVFQQRMALETRHKQLDLLKGGVITLGRANCASKWQSPNRNFLFNRPR